MFRRLKSITSTFEKRQFGTFLPRQREIENKPEKKNLYMNKYVVLYWLIVRRIILTHTKKKWIPTRTEPKYRSGYTTIFQIAGEAVRMEKQHKNFSIVFIEIAKIVWNAQMRGDFCWSSKFIQVTQIRCMLEMAFSIFRLKQPTSVVGN